uniref:Uncharacterized protein n=1 Tax=Moniliophthora roreri TaxID=221103 RepID=A0A0W0FBN9_MONRR
MLIQGSNAVPRPPKCLIVCLGFLVRIIHPTNTDSRIWPQKETSSDNFRLVVSS